jgi:hypothetical protein
MVNTVIVDERDSSIQYSNGWNDNGQFLEFDGTTRWSSNQGSTATFTFGGAYSCHPYAEPPEKCPPQAVPSRSTVQSLQILGKQAWAL